MQERGVSDTVWDYLSLHTPQQFTARDLSGALDLHRKDINRALYEMLDSKPNICHTQDLPPKWGVVFCDGDKPATPNPSERHKTMVYVDLGNVHDCFKHACVYAQHLPEVFVTGAADPNYNHWTPTDVFSLEKLDKTDAALSKTRYYKSQQGLKDAAELMLFAVAISDVLLHGQEIEQIILCSKDNAVDTMRHILDTYMSQSNNIQVHLCRNWEELHSHLYLLE